MTQYQLRLALFSAMMIINMNFAIGLSYESEIFMKSVPKGVIGDRSIHFTQLEDANNYSDGNIDYNIIATNIIMMLLVHTVVMSVININDITFNNLRWLYQL